MDGLPEHPQEDPSALHPISRIPVTVSGLEGQLFSFPPPPAQQTTVCHKCPGCQDADDRSRRECMECLGTGGRCAPPVQHGGTKVKSNNRRFTASSKNALVRQAWKEGSWVAVRSAFVWLPGDGAGEGKWVPHPRLWQPIPPKNRRQSVLEGEDGKMLKRALDRIDEVCVASVCSATQCGF